MSMLPQSEIVHHRARHLKSRYHAAYQAGQEICPCPPFSSQITSLRPAQSCPAAKLMAVGSACSSPQRSALASAMCSVSLCPASVLKPASAALAAAAFTPLQHPISGEISVPQCLHSSRDTACRHAEPADVCCAWVWTHRMWS